MVMAEGVVGTLCSAIYGILCAKLWGPELSGITTLAFALASFFSFISCLSIDQIVIARYVSDKEHQNLFLTTLYIRSAATLLSFIGLMGSSLAMNDFLGAWIWLPAFAFIQNALLTMDLLRLRTQALNELHRQSPWRIKVIFIIFFSKLAVITSLPAVDSVWITQLLAIFEAILLLAISCIFTHHHHPVATTRSIKWSVISGYAKKITNQSWHLFLANLLVILFLKMDYLFLAQLSTARDLGLYASAMRVLEIYVALGNLALLQLYPQLTADKANSASQYQSSLRYAFGFAYMIAGLIIFFNVIVGQWIIRNVLGPEYDTVARYSSLFCILAIPLLSGTVRGFAISLQGIHYNHFIAAAIGIFVSLPILYILIPKLGFKGALLADIAGYYSSAMLSSILLPSLRSIAQAQWHPRFHLLLRNK